MTSWREKANKVITQVMKETDGLPIEARMKAISEAYPFGPRSMHPYRIWLSAVKMAKVEMLGGTTQKPKEKPPEINGQLSIFLDVLEP